MAASQCHHRLPLVGTPLYLALWCAAAALLLLGG